MTDEEYLAHIESAILEIRSHTAGMSQEAYEADSKTQRAVERNLQIVGDAAHSGGRPGFETVGPDCRGGWQEL